MVDHQAQIVQEIADTIKCAADVAMRLGDPVWCELVFVSFPDQFGEGIETVHIGAMAARAKVRGEVVRLHLHLNDLAKSHDNTQRDPRGVGATRRKWPAIHRA